MNMLYSPGRAAALFAAVFLVACGGDDPAPNPAPAPSTGTVPDTTPDTPAQTPAPAPVPVPATPVAEATGNCNVTDFVAQTLLLVNEFRSQARTCGSTTYPAAPALAWNSKLTQAAYAHSADMAAKNYFSHTGSDGSSYSQRITAAGYTWSGAAENIAAGYPTLAAVMKGWQDSPGHCVNLMSSNSTQVGLSCVKGAAGATYGTYWTMSLARPR